MKQRLTKNPRRQQSFSEKLEELENKLRALRKADEEGEVVDLTGADEKTPDNKPNRLPETHDAKEMSAADVAALSGDSTTISSVPKTPDSDTMSTVPKLLSKSVVISGVDKLLWDDLLRQELFSIWKKEVFKELSVAVEVDIKSLPGGSIEVHMTGDLQKIDYNELTHRLRREMVALSNLISMRVSDDVVRAAFMKTAADIQVRDKTEIEVMHTTLTKNRQRRKIKFNEDKNIVHEPKEQEYLKCMEGHTLSAFQVLETTYSCDMCGREDIVQNATMYGCRRCNWDVCEKCYFTKPRHSRWFRYAGGSNGGKRFVIRQQPSSAGVDFAPKTMMRLKPGDVIEVCETMRLGEDVWVKLADGRGWAITHKNGKQLLEKFDPEKDKGKDPTSKIFTGSFPCNWCKAKFDTGALLKSHKTYCEQAISKDDSDVEAFRVILPSHIDPAQVECRQEEWEQELDIVFDFIDFRTLEVVGSEKSVNQMAEVLDSLPTLSVDQEVFAVRFLERPFGFTVVADPEGYGLVVEQVSSTACYDCGIRPTMIISQIGDTFVEDMLFDDALALLINASMPCFLSFRRDL